MKYLLAVLLTITIFGALFVLGRVSTPTEEPALEQEKLTQAQTAEGTKIILFSDLPSGGKGTLWSSWGDGCFASNGKYYTAIGDHLGYDGNSFVYEYDPSSGAFKKVVDISRVIGQKAGDYGHGKIHAPIHEYQGWLYFATYRGKARQVEEAYKKGYTGSLLFRYDLKSQKVENLGAIAPKQALPASVLDAKRGLLYYYAVDPGELLIYDINKRSVKFKGGAEFTGGYRSFFLDRDGTVYFSNRDGKIHGYHPDKNSIAPTEMMLPGSKNVLRAASKVTSSGRLFGMTHNGRMFELIPSKNVVKDLGPNYLSGMYTAVMILSPDEKYIYFAPGAHGSAAESGTPIVQFRISDGSRKVISYLKDQAIAKLNYLIAGNYNLQIDPKGTTLYGTFNGAKYTGQKKQDDFGLPSLAIISIPESERK